MIQSMNDSIYNFNFKKLRNYELRSNKKLQS